MSPVQRVEIKVKGQIDEHWSKWFDDLALIHTEDGDTVLSGQVIDQAALHGLLAKLRDVGLSIASVSAVEIEQ